MQTVVLTVEFCAGHRILGHKGKCDRYHGHNYTAEVCVARKDEQLDGMGMVIDFADLKSEVKGWIDANWDHRMILNQNDPIFALDRKSYTALFADAGKDPYTFPYQPTAENMARHLDLVVTGLLGPAFRVLWTTVRETPTCSATFIGS